MKWRIVGRRIVITAKALYHGISLVGFADDAKTMWAGLGSVLTPMVLRFQQVREWLLERTTYLFALEQIGEYGPWVSGAIFLFILTRRTYLRGLPEVLEAEGLTESATEDPAPELPAIPKVDEEVERFHALESEMLFILQYLPRRSSWSQSDVVARDSRMWALEDNLKEPGLQFPDPKEGVKLLGLMTTGNLARARQVFPSLPFCSRQMTQLNWSSRDRNRPASEPGRYARGQIAARGAVAKLRYEA